MTESIFTDKHKKILYQSQAAPEMHHIIQADTLVKVFQKLIPETGFDRIVVFEIIIILDITFVLFVVKSRYIIFAERLFKH